MSLNRFNTTDEKNSENTGPSLPEEFPLLQPLDDATFNVVNSGKYHTIGRLHRVVNENKIAFVAKKLPNHYLYAYKGYAINDDVLFTKIDEKIDELKSAGTISEDVNSEVLILFLDAKDRNIYEFTVDQFREGEAINHVEPQHTVPREEHTRMWENGFNYIIDGDDAKHWFVTLGQ